MKAALWYNAKDIRVEETSEPTPGTGEVKIKVAYCGICGTDFHEYVAGPIFIPVEKPHPLTQVKAPVILGHEFSGEVVEVGPGVTNVKVGDRVCVEPIYNCGECVSCKRGSYNICEKIGFIGLSGSSGGFAEYCVAPANMAHKIPDEMSFEQAALVEPAAVTVHAVRQSGMKIGDTVAVFGTGPIGLLVIQAAKAAGASKIIAVEVSPERQEFARKVGADIVINPLEKDAVLEIQSQTNSLGVDVSFEVAGIEATINLAIQSTKPEGNIVTISIWEKAASIPLNNLLFSERKLITIIAYRNIFPEVIQLIARGQIKALDVVTKFIKLDDIVTEGFEALLKSKSQVKILVSPSQ